MRSGNSGASPRSVTGTGLVIFAAIMLMRSGNPFGLAPYLGQADEAELRKLDAFFKDPLVNFEVLKGMKDPGEKIAFYARWNGDRIEDFFITHYQVFDERKIEILIYLLRYYRGNRVPDEAARIFSLQPAMFVRELEKAPEWEDIISDISWSWENFSPGLQRLGDSDFERKIKERTLFFQKDREEKIKLIGDFVEDAVSNFEKIKKLDNLQFWLRRYENAQAKDGWAHFALSSLSVNNFSEIDENKIEILVYLMIHCGHGADGELLAGDAERIFKDYPELFVGVLRKTREWKRIIDVIRYEQSKAAFLECLKKLGNTPFEKELKRYVAEKK